jgi:predicted permease
MSLGARGGRLVRQVLTESVTLALVGGAASLVVGLWGGRVLLGLASGSAGAVPLRLPFDWGLLAFVTGVSLATGIGFGLAPAARMARADLHDAFKSGTRVAGRRRSGAWSAGRLLVVSQVGLSLTLLVVAVVFVRSLRNLLAVDPGYDRTSVVAARLEVRAAGYLPEQLPALYQRLLDGVRGVPGVASASLSQYGVATGSARTSSVEVPGKVRGPEWEGDVQVNVVTEDFFSTLGMRLVRGRGFTRADDSGAPRVAVVTESMARKFFDTDNPIGLRFGYDQDPIFEVVGVARDLRPNSLRSEPNPMMFVPLAQEMGPITSLEARVTGSPAAVGEAIRRGIATVDKNLPVREVVTVAELLDRGVAREHMVSDLTGAFGALAALLAAVGLYGVMSYSVSRRTNELGVRVALGASPAALRGLVLKDTFAIVAAGLLVGGMLLVPTLRLIKSQVYGMSPQDPVALAVAAGLLLVVGVGSAAVPAWRASRVDPVEALRRD